MRDFYKVTVEPVTEEQRAARRSPTILIELSGPDVVAYIECRLAESLSKKFMGARFSKNRILLAWRLTRHIKRELKRIAKECSGG